MIDLSGGLQQQLKTAVQRAVALQRANKSAEAADAFERCSGLMTVLVKEALSDEVRQQRLHKAREYYELAAKLRASPPSQGKGVEGSDSNSANTKRNASEPSSKEEFSSRIKDLLKKTDVTWSDVKGLDSVITAVRQTFSLASAPLPEGTKRMVPRALLLYGPPGTGKTLLAAAASNELDASFFSVEVGSLLSKYYGESSQLVAELFVEARRRPRSLIFFDEFDALTPSRDKEVSEAARNVLTALMTGWDGIDSKSAESMIYVMGATNRPWDIEKAVLSRFGKSVYIPLPDAETRCLMLKSNIDGNGYSCDISYEALSEKTQNYSGRDIASLCTEAVALMLKNSNPDLLDSARNDKVLKIRPISENEMNMAIGAIRPQVTSEELKRFEEFGQNRR